MLTADQLRRLARANTMPKHAEAMAVAALKWMPKHGITTPLDVAAFWANVAAETGGFRILEENLNYSAKGLIKSWPTRFKTLAYARQFERQPRKIANKVYRREYFNNLVTPDDGWNYRGSGALQTTGRSNFEAVKRRTGVDVVSNPDLLRTDVDLGIRAACIFWQEMKVSAPANRGDITRVRKIVNGGAHGLDRVKRYFSKARSIIKREGMGPASAAPVARPPKTKKVPLGYPQQSAGVTSAIIEKYRHLLPDHAADHAFVGVAVRGYFRDSKGKPGRNDRGIYDDALFLLGPAGYDAYPFNVDPSRHRKGIASIRVDQAVCYKPGPHGYRRKGGPYPAFRQHEKCWVHRDNGRDQFGMFHVNLHRGGWNGTSSLGCMTVERGIWVTVRDKIKSHLRAAKQETFYVIVLEYQGGEPPVSVAPAKPSTRPPTVPKKPMDQNNAAPGLIGAGLVAAVGGLVWWWDRVTAEVSTFFTWIGF
ncbi:MAG: glycoside hydrolase family 19 protein [Pseudomonadota bacterium]